MKSETNLEQTYLQPLAQGVAQVSTPSEERFLQEDMLKVAVLLLESLSHEVLSGDLLDLAKLRTLREYKRSGLEEGKFIKILDRLMLFMEVNRKSNPLSGLF